MRLDRFETMEKQARSDGVSLLSRAEKGENQRESKTQRVRVGIGRDLIPNDLLSEG